MKRTCLQINTNNHKQTTCDPDSNRDHRVKKWLIEKMYNRKLFSNFYNLYR